MKSTLQELYYGNLAPEDNVPDVAHHWKMFHDELKVKAPELEKGFDILKSDVMQSYVANNKEMFFQGFSLAVKLLAEGLAY